MRNVFYSESSDSQEACAVGFDVERLPGIFQTCIHRQGISLPNPLFFFFCLQAPLTAYIPNNPSPAVVACL